MIDLICGEGACAKEKVSYQFEYEELKNDFSYIIEQINDLKRMYYYIDLKNEKAIYLFDEKNNKILYTNLTCKILKEKFKDLFENANILKCGTNLKEDWRFLKENEITAKNMMFDIHVAAYLINSTKGKYNIEELSQEYLNYDVSNFSNNKENNQMNLFDAEEQKIDERKCAYVFAIYKLHSVLERKTKRNKCVGAI